MRHDLAVFVRRRFEGKEGWLSIGFEAAYFQALRNAILPEQTVTPGYRISISSFS
jgi:hypothetical protein